MFQYITKAVVIFVLCELFALKAYTNSPKTLIYKGEKNIYNLLENIEIYEDVKKNISLEQIISDADFSIKVHKKFSEIYLGYSYSDFWLKFKIFNDTRIKQHLILAGNNPRIKCKQLYILKEDSIIKLTTSSRFLTKTSYNINNRHFISQLSLDPKTEHTIYLKISSEGGPLNISMNLFSPLTFLSKTERNNILNGVYYGVLVTILFTSLLIMLSNKKSRSEMYNFWFFFYVVMICIFSFIFDGYGLQFFWTGNLKMNNQLTIISLLISYIPISYFISNYFNARKSQPLLKRILDFIVYASILMIIAFAFNFFTFKFSVIISFILAYILITSGFILAIINYKSTPKFALFFISSLSLIVISISLLFVHLQSGYLNNYFQDVAIKAGFAFMSVLLTIGLSIRMRIQREKAYVNALEDLRRMKEKEEKINQELEIEVYERTKLLLQNKTKLEDANKAISQQNEELELAFKKSSRQHVKLQKALRLINEHKDSLEKAFKKSSSQHVKLQRALLLINKQKTELEKAYEEIKESSKLKEIFLANTSHEIRTPLNAIVGFTNLLLKTEASSDQQKFIKNIKTSGENLLVIINDILDFSKIEAGKLTFESTTFSIYELVDQLFDTLRMRVNEKGILLENNIDSRIPEVIIGDPFRLNQILINLLSNSIKFTNKGGKVSLNLNLVENKNDTVNIQFQVKDSGIGISEDKLKNIFQSFTQAESDTTRKYGGTGLGLAIVKQLVELQNGKIDIKSKVNKGTTFNCELKFKIGSKAQLDEYRLKDITSSDERFKVIKILLVEDNYINQQLALDTIKSWNQQIEVDVAITGYEALNQVKNNDYHLILMDIQMPEMDGIEATKIIRKDLKPPKCNVPIVAMTAHAMKEERETCERIGMNDYITKPFNPDDLFRKIILYSSSVKNIAPVETIKADNEKIIDEKTVKLDFEFLNLGQLNKIYRNNTKKISKIFKMYLDTIPDELKSLKENLDKNNIKKVKTLAHTLKTKIGYLGLISSKEKLIFIEKNANNNKQVINMIQNITEIQDIWDKTIIEINKYIEHSSE